MKINDRMIIMTFEAFAISHGFKNRKKLFWYSYSNGLLRVIGFHKKSFKYETLYFIQPLYDYNECFVLDYGDVLTRRYSNDAINLSLYMDSSEEIIKSNIVNNMRCLEKQIIPTLNMISGFDDIMSAIKKGFFFCGKSNILRLKAYSSLYEKNYLEAANLFEEYIWYEKNKGYCVETRIDEPSVLLKYLHSSPSETQQILQSNISRSIETLKIYC